MRRVTIKTILVPTDFSASSRGALGFALDLAKRLGAQVQLVHVFQLPYYVGWEDGVAMAAASVEFMEQMRKRGEEQLAVQTGVCKAAGVTARGEQVDGAPYLKIVELSAKVDLVVMGTHGRTGLPRLMLGSVAERVVRMAKCPVITVPEPHAA